MLTTLPSSLFDLRGTDVESIVVKKTWPGPLGNPPKNCVTDSNSLSFRVFCIAGG